MRERVTGEARVGSKITVLRIKKERYSFDFNFLARPRSWVDILGGNIISSAGMH